MIVSTLRTSLIIQVITFATSILIARILGPVGRGELALVLLYPQLAAGIAVLGVDRAVAILGGRGELARPEETIKKLVLLFSIPAMLVGYASVLWRVADAHLAILANLYLLYVPAMYFFLLTVSFFNGVGDFARFNRTRLGFYLFNFVFVIAIWVAAPAFTLDWVVLANLASVYGVMVLAMVMLCGFKHSVGRSSVKLIRGDLRAVLRSAALFALPVMLAQLSNFAPLIAMEHFMGVRALGFFVVFLSFSRLISPIGSAIGSYVFHLGISGESRDIARIFRFSLIVYSVSAVSLWPLASWLIPMFFGQDFVVDGFTVGTLLFCTVLSLLADSMAEFLNGQRKVFADICGRILYLIPLCLLCVWLVSSLGLRGISLAMAMGELLRCCYLVRRVSLESNQTIKKFWRITRLDIFTILNGNRPN